MTKIQTQPIDKTIAGFVEIILSVSFFRARRQKAGVDIEGIEEGGSGYHLGYIVSGDKNDSLLKVRGAGGNLVYLYVNNLFIG